MKSLFFKYDKNTNVRLVSSSIKSFSIEFTNNDSLMPFLSLKYRPYLREIVFYYDKFRVWCTSKYGEAFTAITSEGDYSLMIRQKKRKTQLLFARYSSKFLKIKYDDDKTDLACYIDGQVNFDKALIDDFINSRKSKPFNEEEYLNSLDEEDKNMYLQSKSIDTIVETLSKNLGLSEEEIDKVESYIFCLADDDNDKIEFLKENSGIDKNELLSKFVLKAKNQKEEKIVYTYEMPRNISIRYSDDIPYKDERFNIYNYPYSDAKELCWIEDAFADFDGYYEDNKDIIEFAMQKVKKTIDKVSPAFKEFITSLNK